MARELLGPPMGSSRYRPLAPEAPVTPRIKGLLPHPPEIPRCVCGSKLRSVAKLQAGDGLRDVSSERICPRGSTRKGGNKPACGAVMGLIYKDQKSAFLELMSRTGILENGGVQLYHHEKYPRFVATGTILYIIAGNQPDPIAH